MKEGVMRESRARGVAPAVPKRILLLVLSLVAAACAHPAVDRTRGASGALGVEGSRGVDAGIVEGGQGPRFDHHVHSFGPSVRQWLETELGLPPLPQLGTDVLLSVLERDGVGRAALLSNAYFFAHDTPEQPRDLEAFRAENDRVADAVAEHPRRLAGFFAIDPLAESAFPEMERCAGRGVFTGLKLHLANSEVDLRDPDHVARLGDVFERANALGFVIVVHLRTAREFGREEAQTFIDRVLSRAPDVPVQIAHLAGWGGYDPATDAALGAFVDRAARIAGETDRVYFDVSAVVRPLRSRDADGSDPHASDPDW